MGHNYAKPLTTEARLARVLSRLPPEWEVRAERAPQGLWRVWMRSENQDGVWSEPAEQLVDAMEDVWRALR